jgi:glycosyltransferase involved in cell wall biosynthesis
MMADEYGLKAAMVVHNFHPEPLNHNPRVDSGHLRVIWVANFKPFKNPEIFVDLAESFIGNQGIEFVMIGRPGDPSQYRSLHERINRLKNLTYLGELSIDQVNEEIARSDIFVNTSSAEGFPNTFIQAWLRGVPVVSYKVDPDGCLSRGGSGILAGSTDRLASAINELLSDRKRLRQLGEAARAYGYANHTSKQAEKLVQMLSADWRPPRVNLP